MPPSSEEFVPSATPLLIPWNLIAIRVDHCCSSLPGITPGLKDHRCPSTPGITPGLKDHLCCLLGNLHRALHRWEFPGIGLLSAWNSAAHPSWCNTRTRGPPSPPSSLESLGISRLSVRIDVATPVWYSTRTQGFYLPRVFVQEPYLYHPVFRVCVCLTKNSITSSGLVLSFQRTVHTCWYCVYLFREQLVFLVP